MVRQGWEGHVTWPYGAFPLDPLPNVPESFGRQGSLPWFFTEAHLDVDGRVMQFEGIVPGSSLRLGVTLQTQEYGDRTAQIFKMDIFESSHKIAKILAWHG